MSIILCIFIIGFAVWGFKTQIIGQWFKADAPTAVIQEDDPEQVIQEFVLEGFDLKGDHSWKLVGEAAHIYEDKNIFIERNVILSLEQDTKVYADKVLWQTSKSQFPPEIKIEKDRVLERDEKGEKKRFRIVNVDGDTVFMDGNHPMAGKTLHYDVDIVSIRPATEEELEKGQPNL